MRVLCIIAKSQVPQNNAPFCRIIALPSVQHEIHGVRILSLHCERDFGSGPITIAASVDLLVNLPSLGTAN